MALEARMDLKRIEVDAKRMPARTPDAQAEPAIAFIEGPPTMNGMPHAGHLRGRIIKDFWYRYKTLQGYRVVFNAGWDTQGLPVELQAQKELGVSGGKAEIMKKVGVEALVKECKRIVAKYHKAWVAADEMLGISLNQDAAYWTYRDEYIEREWQILRKAKEDGILEEDYTVIAYCPSCQASLSHAEVNQGYEMVKDPSLYYKARLQDEDAYLIVWTTMPFTLVTDAMIGVRPDERYAYVDTGNETWIIGATRLEEFLKEAGVAEYDVIRTVPGSDLDGKKYVHPLLDIIPELAKLAQDKNYHIIVSEEFVDPLTGSGLVHLSPANGEEDIAVASRRGVAIFNPIDDEAKFTDDAGAYAGVFVRDADEMISSDLRERGALARISSIKHKYPLCWRSRHPIIWMARRGWFYKLEKLGERAVEAAGRVEYFFDQPRNRFLGIIGEKHPWCISRERFWGCPMPAWNCRKCGNRDWFYSRGEIVDAASELPDGRDFELHRPWIDRVTTRCTRCGGTDTYREDFVLDTWHNSGAAPYASLDDDAYSKMIPAPFFTEGIDQTRGWAYTLLIENVIMSGAAQAPYTAFLFQGHVLDKNGNKMSKSRGNVVDAHDLLSEHPADLVRLYFLAKASPIEPLNFSTEEMGARPYQVLSTLYNLHLYYDQNSSYDKFDGSGVSWAAENGLLREPERWLLSKLEGLKEDVAGYNESCRFHESARAIDVFLIGILSQTYIPMTRGELWDEDDSKRRRRFAIYAVLREVLCALDRMIYPFSPHTAVYLYRRVFGGDITADGWPAQDDSMKDAVLEESFDLLNEAVSVAAAARNKARLKRRWPLDEAVICTGAGAGKKLEGLAGIAAERLNVQQVRIVEVGGEGLDRIMRMREAGLPAVPVLEPRRDRIGPKAGKNAAALIMEISRINPLDMARSLAEGTCRMEAGGTTTEIEEADFEIFIGASDGYAAAERDGCIVFLSTSRNPEMTARGLLKDVARRIQALRKERGYNPTDMLKCASITGLDAGQVSMLEKRIDELAFLVRVKSVTFEEKGTDYKDDKIDGQGIRIDIW